MLYNGWVSDIAKRFQQSFDNINAVYNFDLGDEFEVAVATVLRDVLPDRYGVCRGFVVEQSGRMAGDDIIIYDRGRFPTLRSLGADLSKKDQVPVEAVLAYIEAKHRLQLTGDGGQSLHKACTQVEAVRTLQRDPVSLNMLAPYVQSMGLVTVPGGRGWPSVRNPLYCAIYARHVEPQENARETLANALHDRESMGDKLPDLVAAGTAMALPALYTPPVSPEAKSSVAIRPFVDVSGNTLVYCEPTDVFGLALIHLLWSMEIVSLGTLPWPRLINEAVQTGGDSFTVFT